MVAKVEAQPLTSREKAERVLGAIQVQNERSCPGYTAVNPTGLETVLEKVSPGISTEGSIKQAKREAELPLGAYWFSPNQVVRVWDALVRQDGNLPPTEINKTAPPQISLTDVAHRFGASRPKILKVCRSNNIPFKRNGRATYIPSQYLTAIGNALPPRSQRGKR